MESGKTRCQSWDVVLISYSDKSKSGTFKFGIVESVEVDPDGLIRTCVVGYRIVRSDMPVEELRLYYRGLKFKRIRVPVQRFIILLPIEEQDEPNYLSKVKAVEEKTVDEHVPEEECKRGGGGLLAGCEGHAGYCDSCRYILLDIHMYY